MKYESDKSVKNLELSKYTGQSAGSSQKPMIGSTKTSEERKPL